MDNSVENLYFWQLMRLNNTYKKLTVVLGKMMMLVRGRFTVFSRFIYWTVRADGILQLVFVCWFCDTRTHKKNHKSRFWHRVCLQDWSHKRVGGGGGQSTCSERVTHSYNTWVSYVACFSLYVCVWSFLSLCDVFVVSFGCRVSLLSFCSFSLHPVTFKQDLLIVTCAHWSSLVTHPWSVFPDVMQLLVWPGLGFSLVQHIFQMWK